MGKKITERNRVLAGALLCGIIALAGCGGKEAPMEQFDHEPMEQPAVEDGDASADGTNDSALEDEGIMDSADVENTAADSDEESAEKAQALYEAQIRHYYGGVLSQIIAARQLPDGELDTYSLDAGFGEMRDNHFAVTDIDGDDREELIVSYSNASMAGMMAIIYDYDPVLGELKREFTEFPALTCYDNGIIRVEDSHNHSRGEFWPFTLYQYQPDSDRYVQTAYVSTWDKEIVDEWTEGHPFSDELDADGDGTLFNISEGAEATYEYEDFKYNQADFEKWYDGIMEGAMWLGPFFPRSMMC